MIAHYTISDVSIGLYRPIVGKYLLHKINSKEVKRIDLLDDSSRIIDIDSIKKLFVFPLYPLRNHSYASTQRTNPTHLSTTLWKLPK